MAYADIEDLRGRVPWIEITATSKPSITQATKFITRGQQIVDSVLKSSGLPAPYTDGTDAAAVLGEIVLDYAEGRTRHAHASSQGREDDDDGEVALRRFSDHIKDMRSNGPMWGGILAGGTGPERNIKSHVVDGIDEDGATDPWFTRDTEF